MVNNTLKMEQREPFRIQSLGDKHVLWIDSQYMDVVKDTMPGVIDAEETERSIDNFVHTREFEITLDPLAKTPQDAIAALTTYLNAAIGIEQLPASALPDLLAGGDTNPPAPIPSEA